MAEETQTLETPAVETAPVEPQTTAPVQTQETTPDNIFDVSQVPPELKPAYEKMEAHFKSESEKSLEKFKDYDTVSQRAKALDSLIADPRFQEWYKGLSAPKSEPKAPAKSVVDDLTPEQLSEISQDPKKFTALVRAVAREEQETLIAPKVNETAQQLTTMKMEQEIVAFANSKGHEDFWDLEKRGLINATLKKYDYKISLEDAWKLARYSDVEKKALDAAHGIVNGKKTGSLERPGVATHRTGGAPIKVRDVTEAMKIAVDYQQAGRPEPEFEYVA